MGSPLRLCEIFCIRIDRHVFTLAVVSYDNMNRRPKDVENRMNRGSKLAIR